MIETRVVAVATDYSHLSLELIAIQQHLLNVERGNKGVVEILPKVLLVLTKIGQICEEKCGELAGCVKGFGGVVGVVFARLLEGGGEGGGGGKENSSDIRGKQSKMLPKQPSENSDSLPLPDDPLPSPSPSPSPSLPPFYPLLPATLSHYTPNASKIRHQMSSFTQIVNTIQSNTSNFFSSILLSHQQKFLDSDSLHHILLLKQRRQKEIKDTLAQKYHTLITYLQDLLHQLQDERTVFDRQKQQLIEAILKEHILKKNPGISKTPQNPPKTVSQQTQTYLTSDQLSSLYIQHQQTLLANSHNDRQKSLMMQELYLLKQQSDTFKFKKQSDSLLLQQNTKIIHSMQENVLQICNYAAEMEYSHIDLNNKIDELGELGLEEYIDEKEFSSFSMDFKVSLFNIFRKIVAKYTKVNEESKRERERVSVRRGGGGVEGGGGGRGGTFANFRRASRRMEDVNPFMWIDKEGDEGEKARFGGAGNKSPRIDEINESAKEEESDGEELINENTVKSAKRGFVSSVIKKSQAHPVQTPPDPQSHHPPDDPLLPPDLLVDSSGSKPRKKPTGKSVSSLKWKYEDSSSDNGEFQTMINEKLTAKFEVVEKPIQEMNSEIMNAPERLMKRLKARAGEAVAAEAGVGVGDKTKGVAGNWEVEGETKTQTQMQVETEPGPSKFSKRMKSILSKTSSFGFNKKMKSIMYKQAEIYLEKQTNGRRQEQTMGGKRSRFSHFSVAEGGNENLLESNVVVAADVGDKRGGGGRQSTVLKRVSKISIDKGVGGKRATSRPTKLTKIPTQIAEEIDQQHLEPNNQQPTKYMSEKENSSRHSTFAPHSTHPPLSSQQLPSTPLTIMKNPEFTRLSRLYQHSKQPFPPSSPLLLQIPQHPSPLKKQPPPATTGISSYIRKIAKQYPSLKSNRPFMNELKLIFDLPTNQFNKTFRHNFDLGEAVEMASSVHLKKCGSIFCTHLLRFYETVRRLAGEKKGGKEELVPSVHRINVIERQEKQSGIGPGG